MSRCSFRFFELFHKRKLILIIFFMIILINLFHDDEQENRTIVINDNPEIVDTIDKIDEILSKFDKHIAFFFISGSRIITGVPNCCVISAAKQHPKSAVIVFAHARMKSPANWMRHKNVFVLKLNETHFLRNTPLEKWHMNGTWRQSSLWDYHLGDALRLAYLWKYGGAYLDTDVIVLKPILEKFPNSLAYENEDKTAIDGAVLIFDRAHPFINLAMNKFVDEFQDTWGYQGPSLMRRSVEIYKQLQMDSLASLNILNSFTFYPVSWKNLEIKKLYQAQHLHWSVEKVKNSSTIHLWNKASKKFLIEKGSLMERLLSKC